MARPVSMARNAFRSVIASRTPPHGWFAKRLAVGVKRIASKVTPGRFSAVSSCASASPSTYGAPAADADRRLDDAEAGIEAGRGEAAHVRRGVDPRQAGVVVPHRAFPAAERDDFEIDAEVPKKLLVVVHLCELADRHAVLDHDVVVRDERRLALAAGAESLSTHPVAMAIPNDSPSKTLA